jgi:hypothetical protein
VKYLPPEQIASPELDHILQNRLDFTFPLTDVQVMSNLQRSEWYGSDGMSKAYDFLSGGSFGNRTVEEEKRKSALKAQRVIDLRANKRPITSKNDDEATTSSGAQQKRPRPSYSKQDFPKKKSRSVIDIDVVMDDLEPSLVKGKDKASIILAPDSDSDDPDNPDHMDTRGNSQDSPPPQSP